MSVTPSYKFKLRKNIGYNADPTNMLPLSVKSNTRVSFILKDNATCKIVKKQENMGVLSYIRRNGLEKPQNYHDFKSTL